MTRSLAVLALAALAGCSGAPATSEDGRVLVSVSVTSAALSASVITRIAAVVTAADPVADPSSVAQDLAYDSATGAFSGTLVVPAGARVVKATAYAGATLVGSGTQPVTIVKSQTAQVSMTILDTTGGPPVPDHSPLVTGLSVPQNAAVGDQLTVSATAMDQDLDPLAFHWSTSPVGCGTFANAQAASTTWTAVQVGSCAVQVTVTANGKSDSKSLSVAIVAATGSVQISGTYVPNPVITQLTLAHGGITDFICARTASDATDHVPLAAGTQYRLTAALSATAGTAITLTSSCGGAISYPSSTAALWTAPQSTACVLTVSVTDHGLTDAFPIVVVVN